MTEGVRSTRRRANDRSPGENALRYIGSQRSGQLIELLKSAVEWPSDDLGVALRPLIRPTDVLKDWAVDERAEVLELLIKTGVEHPSVGPSEQSRERRVLRAALRLPDPEISHHWAATLADRWQQLKALEQVFPKASTNTTQPMEAAWTRAVRKLDAYLARRFDELATAADWLRFKQQNSPGCESAERGEESDGHDGLLELRPASQHAQPFHVNLLVTTVFLEGRATLRRVTERVVTARADGVEFYVARAYSGDRTFSRKYAPVRGLWGCRADPIPVVGAGELIVARLRFPHPLRRGEQAYFASEAYLDAVPTAAGDRDWIDVDIDHHGILRGRLRYGGLVPVSGLTIRVCFDVSCVPVSAWWYAEMTEHERTIEPPTGDGRLLEIVDGQVGHTFVNVCNPRESYGIAYRWGDD